jgi:ComEC/Rec2-related protein
VISPPLTSGATTQFTLNADSIYTESGAVVLRNGAIRCESDSTPLKLGDKLILSGRLRLASPPAVPGGFDELPYLRSQGLWGSFRATTTVRINSIPTRFDKLRLVVRHHFFATLSLLEDSQSRQLLQCLFWGEQVLPKETKKWFRDSGLSHMLAISGLHLVLLSSALSTILLLLPLPRNARLIALMAMIWFYLLMVGLLPSLFRAVVMATLVCLSPLVQRTTHALNTLGLAGILWLVWSPLSLLTPSFQLSFVATAAIIIVFPLAREATEHFTKSIPIVDNLCQVLLVTLAAMVGTIPVVIYHFGVVSLYGIGANLLGSALLSAIMWTMLALLGVGLALPLLGHGLGWICGKMIMLLVLLASQAETMPWSIVQVSSQLLLCFLILPLTALLCAATIPQWRSKILLGGTILFLTILPATLLYAHYSKTLTLHILTPRNMPPLLICTHPAQKAAIWATSEQALTTNRQNITTLLRPCLNQRFSAHLPFAQKKSTPPTQPHLTASHFDIRLKTTSWSVVVGDSLLHIVNRCHPNLSLTTRLLHPAMSIRLPAHAAAQILSQQPPYYPFSLPNR